MLLNPPFVPIRLPGVQSLVSGRWLASDAVWLAAILTLSTVLILLWTCTVPFQQAPDEAAHFQVVRFIRDFGRLPRFAPEELWLLRTQVGAVESYATFPPLAYILAALLTVATHDHSFWASRAVSIVSYLGTIWLTFAIARRLLPSTRVVAVSSSLVVALLPQFTFTGAYVNNDALAVLEAGLLLWLLLEVGRTGSSATPFAAMGVVIGTMLLTKYTAYAVAGIGFGVALLAAWRARNRLLSSVALILGVALSSGWWFIRNWQLYGELVPSKVVAQAKAAAGGNTLFVPIDHGVTVLTLSTQTDFWLTTLKSFVGVFGYLSIFLAPGYYVASAVVAALALLGMLLRLRQGRVPIQGWLVLGVGLTICAGTILQTMVVAVYGEYAPLGRYLFGALIPLAIALAAGWYWLGATHRLLAWIPMAAIGWLIALNAVSFGGYLVPGQFSLAVDSVIVEVDKPAGTFAAGQDVEVLGWSLAQGSADWRPFTPELVMEYRRPVDGVLVYLDGAPGVGQLISPAQYGFRRHDVSDFFGGSQQLERIGFRYVIAADELSPGPHELDVCSVVTERLAPICKSRTFEVSG
ncbi:MAG: hypothetical protein QOF51_2808 [Chloroflexota bacterium]|jgi:4-amino-4-deoxy-L-arabinose transferase-like glycosyltransferase|nr:hypothetical protein [Chloroflexota bacterium]